MSQSPMRVVVGTNRKYNRENCDAAISKEENRARLRPFMVPKTVFKSLTSEDQNNFSRYQRFTDKFEGK